MTNNDILKKLRVAHKLRDEDIIKILKLVDFEIGKSELNALYRKEDHPKYMKAGDQILRNFLNGLIIHLRGDLNAGKEREQVYKGQDKPSRYESKMAEKGKTKPKIAFGRKTEPTSKKTEPTSKEGGNGKFEITRKSRPRITKKDEE